MEGSPYETQPIYDINSDDPKKPPVHYEAHVLKPHSLCHIDAPAHILKNGKKISDFFKAGEVSHFFGQTVVAKIPIQEWKPAQNAHGLFHFEVSKAVLIESIQQSTGSTLPPDRILVAPEHYPDNASDQHDPRYAFTLSVEAAEWLDSNQNFKLLGTSWKSTDFQPGSRERPIHKIIFRKALIMECLALSEVPAGKYFLSAFPLPLDGASESPVCPVLFTKDDLFEAQINL